jgi:hypothetical protein
MRRLTARARFNDGLPGELADQLVQQFCDEHPERYLLGVRTDTEKCMLMAESRRDGWTLTK